MVYTEYRWRHGKQDQKFKYTYKDIARLTNLTVETLHVYVSQKKFDPHSLESVINFVNSRKIKNI